MLYSATKSNSRPPRVVVTGAGIVTALGNDYASNAAGFREGRTAFRTVKNFDVSRQRVQTAAEVDLQRPHPGWRLNPRQLQRLDRAEHLLLCAATQAWRQAGWKPGGSLPVVLGTTSGGMRQGEEYYRQATQHPLRRAGQATRVIHYLVQNQSLALTQALGFEGPTTIISNACASGANAIGHAWQLIRQGAATRILTGGYDALSQLVFAGFDSLQALSLTQCRPFDQHRDGLALGEGAAVLTLETLESAQERGATILSEIVGYGATSDRHHLTQPHPDGQAACKTMQSACQAARVSPREVGYLNAHGTGTPLNDAAEAQAIHHWAGQDASTVRVSSTKSSIGHLLGAAGAVETVVCIMTLREGWLPPTTTTVTLDDRCPFELVRQPLRFEICYAMTNSFGFGGANASLLLKRWE